MPNVERYYRDADGVVHAVSGFVGEGVEFTLPDGASEVTVNEYERRREAVMAEQATVARERADELVGARERALAALVAAGVDETDGRLLLGIGERKLTAAERKALVHVK